MCYYFVLRASRPRRRGSALAGGGELNLLVGQLCSSASSRDIPVAGRRICQEEAGHMLRGEVWQEIVDVLSSERETRAGTLRTLLMRTSSVRSSGQRRAGWVIVRTSGRSRSSGAWATRGWWRVACARRRTRVRFPACSPGCPHPANGRRLQSQDASRISSGSPAASPSASALHLESALSAAVAAGGTRSLCLWRAERRWVSAYWWPCERFSAASAFL